MVPTSSDTQGVTGQTVNYFCPFVKGAQYSNQNTVDGIHMLHENLITPPVIDYSAVLDRNLWRGKYPFLSHVKGREHGTACGSNNSF